jgi:cellulose synthase/poly-beta-1,6-N-acetylglucosamine synthase-like glycosyltransferase
MRKLIFCTMLLALGPLVHAQVQVNPVTGFGHNNLTFQGTFALQATPTFQYSAAWQAQSAIPTVPLHRDANNPASTLPISEAYPFFLAVTLALAWFVGNVRYLFGAIIHILPGANFGITKDYTYTPSVSVLLPCFNEGRHVYDTIVSILQSDYPALDVIATDDCSSDDSWYWIQKAAADFPNVKAVRNQENVGKTRTILNACERSESEYVIIVDSDTLLGTNAIREMLSCFAHDPLMGAVGAPANVKNNNENALTSFQTYLYYLGFRLAKIPECLAKTVGCIGGYSLTIRKRLLLEIKPDLDARNWFGTKIRDGEDRFITHQVLLHGYKTYVNMDADVWTIVPNNFRSYWLQQLRWRRSYTRDFSFTVRTLWRHVRDLHPNVSCHRSWLAKCFAILGWKYTYVLTPVVTVLGVIQVFALFFLSPFNWFDFRMSVLYIGTAFLVIWLAHIYHPDQALENPLRLFMYLTWWIVNNLFLSPLAYLTLDSGGWGNRETTRSPQPQEMN